METEELEFQYTLKNRPRLMPGDLCPNRRITLLMLILYYCRGNQANHQQLYVMDWAIRSNEARTLFLQFISGRIEPDDIIIRYDPILSRCIAVAIANGFITDRQILHRGIVQEKPKQYRIRLLPKGKEFIRGLITSYSEVLSDENIFLQSIGTKISQVLVNRLFNEARYEVETQ